MITDDLRQKFHFLINLNKKFLEARVYLVGGIVRDAVLGIPDNDYDFVVTGVGKTELIKFLESQGKIVAESNIETAVFKFLPKNGTEVVDIALPRRETYLGPSRTPMVEVVSDIKEDLARRDFTINAMALPILSFRRACLAGRQASEEKSQHKHRDFSVDDSFEMTNQKEIIDPFRGLDDIKTKTVRAVGDPKERFREDPLRMLRAIRFACQLNFNIEADTFTAIKELKTELTKTYIDDGKTKLRVSKERFMKEFLAALDYNPMKFFDLYDKSGLFDILMPEIAEMKGVEQPKNFHSEGDVFVHTRLALRNVEKSAPIQVKLAVLLHDIGKPPQAIKKNGTIKYYDHDKKSAEMAGKIFKRFPLPREVGDEVVWLTRNHMKPAHFKVMRLSKIKALVRHPYFDDLFQVIMADIKASIRPDGTHNEDWIQETLKAKDRAVKEAKKKKPVEIINGHEVIDIIKKIDKDYTGGPLVGYIKSSVNEAFDDEKIRTKKEALVLASQIAKDKLK